MSLFKKLKSIFNEAIIDDNRRYHLQYGITYVILGLVSLFMTVVNLITKEYTLMISTLVFGILSISNLPFSRINRVCYKISTYLFQVEFIGLFVFFIVTGNPDGFSSIWTLLVPSLGILLFGMINGTIVSGVMFLILIFFFWTPWGKGMLPDVGGYTDTFLLRFPFAYTAFYLVGIFFELIRATTFKKYKQSFTHDSLTGILNRIGFKEKFQEEYNSSSNTHCCFVLFDIDHFKNINDTYGHLIGDIVLKRVAKVAEKTLGTPLCRWGGEEFTAFYPSGDITKEFLQKTLDAVKGIEFESEKGEKFNVTISMGAIIVPKINKYSYSELWNITDWCQYKAKDAGRDTIVLEHIDKK